MNTEERIKAQWELVETIGRVYEKQGFGTITGRIAGLLTVMDKEQFTFDEIVEELNISKSSASHGLRLLETQNQIEYITQPGDRKRYFRVRTQDKFAIIDNHHMILNNSRNIFQSILELKADKNTKVSVYISDVLSLLCFFLEKFEDLKTMYLNK
ncbi:MAG: hypothetical protein PHR81_07205 [Bacteroidales bacterium]|jgi:DNA-binding transcriptional regulator GbsR (MarR family)|nr:hypothetical protein [Bacteroidales bacterium]MDD4214584.1 hypothetical protein [Bacteroidales bacterium]